MLKLWVTGANADRLDQMREKQAGMEIIQRIEAARPAAKGKLRVERFFSWQKSPFARGIYHHIGTGQAAMLARAVQAGGSRLFFAGEHLSQQSSGMEAALLSGRNAAALVAGRAV
jgi:monoamine oxidase